MSELIQDNEVNIDRLESIFKSEYYNTEHDKDGNLIVHAEGAHIYVKIDSDRKFIGFTAFWVLKERAKEIDKLRFASQLNFEYVLLRYCVPAPNMLFAIYEIPFEGGITPHFISHVLKLFLRAFSIPPMADRVGVLA
jgi:hypothetical protein